MFSHKWCWFMAANFFSSPSDMLLTRGHRQRDAAKRRNSFEAYYMGCLHWRSHHYSERRWSPFPIIRSIAEASFTLTNKAFGDAEACDPFATRDIMYESPFRHRNNKYILLLFTISPFFFGIFFFTECRGWQPSENKQRIYQNIFEKKLRWQRERATACEKNRAIKMLKLAFRMRRWLEL